MLYSSHMEQTLENIKQAALKEFLEKGFKAASLRKIVSNAGVTTGAFYGYCKSKEELFSLLVDETYSTILNHYSDCHNDFLKIPADQQVGYMETVIANSNEWLLNYMSCHRPELKLIITKSEGTKYQDFVHRLSEMEANSTFPFIKMLNTTQNKNINLNPKLVHMLSTGLINSYVEIILHDIPFDEARDLLKKISEFTMAGWFKLFDIN